MFLEQRIEKTSPSNYRGSTNIYIFVECHIKTKSTQSRLGRGVAILKTTGLRRNGWEDLFHGNKFRMGTSKGFSTLKQRMLNAKAKDAKQQQYE